MMMLWCILGVKVRADLHARPARMFLYILLLALSATAESNRTLRAKAIHVQEVHLDKHIKLLDSPEIVMAAKSTDSASLVLWNCIKVCMCMGVLTLFMCCDAAIGCRWSLLPTPQHLWKEF